MQTPRRPLGQLRRALLIAWAFSACIAAALLVVPLFALQLIEAALPSGSREVMLTLIAMAGVALLIAWILDFCRELTLVRAGVWIDHTLQPAVIEQGLARGVDGARLKSLTRDVKQIRSALAGGAVPAFLELPWLLTGCALVAFFNPMLAVACAGAVALPILFAFGASRRSSAPGDAAADDWLDEVVSKSGAVSAAGLSAGVARQWEQIDRRHVGSAYTWFKNRAGARACARFLGAAGLIGLLAFGGYLVSTGALLPGVFVAAVLLAARIVSCADQVLIGSIEIAGARAAWSRIAEIDWAGVMRPQVAVKTAPEWITLENVTASHPGSKAPAVNGITLSIAPGECIGVIGPRASGKSSLMAVLAGELAPALGKAAIGSTAIWSIQRCGDRRAIGYVADTPSLLAGTVAENISGFVQGSDEEVVRAAARAGAHDVIASLPRGYDTDIGTSGSRVPMRVRRSIALARALYDRPLAIVLDEPELGLDASERSRLADILHQIRRDGITLVIATGDPSMLRLTDRVVVMAKGTIEGILPSYQITAARAQPERQVA